MSGRHLLDIEQLNMQPSAYTNIRLYLAWVQFRDSSARRPDIISWNRRPFQLVEASSLTPIKIYITHTIYPNPYARVAERKQHRQGRNEKNSSLYETHNTNVDCRISPASISPPPAPTPSPVPSRSPQTGAGRSCDWATSPSADYEP